MSKISGFFKSIGVSINDRNSLRKISDLCGIPVPRLKYYNESNKIPSESDLERINTNLGVSDIEIKINMGFIDYNIMNEIQNKSTEILEIICNPSPKTSKASCLPPPVLQTNLGTLYNGDCLDILKSMSNESVDVVFADPPFNLNKFYPSNIDDNLKEDEYLSWCESWIDECVRVLKFNGSFFLWNIPRWNSRLSCYLERRLTFRHWIAVDIKYRMPIKGRLYPSHYSLLYFCKGEKPKTFNPDRLPMEICPHCKKDLRDYGGYKNKMNPNGVNITDIWYDISPVRHAKYKKRKGANELPLKLMDRIIELSSNDGDIILDPFGGSGTTYIASEIKNRRWIGVEVGPIDGILERFSNIQDEKKFLCDMRDRYNCLFTKDDEKIRKKTGLWTCDSFT